jgi:hypothetical protein
VRHVDVGDDRGPSREEEEDMPAPEERGGHDRVQDPRPYRLRRGEWVNDPQPWHIVPGNEAAHAALRRASREHEGRQRAGRLSTSKAEEQPTLGRRWACGERIIALGVDDEREIDAPLPLPSALHLYHRRQHRQAQGCTLPGLAALAAQLRRPSTLIFISREWTREGATYRP